MESPTKLVDIIKFSDLRFNRVTVHMDEDAIPDNAWHLGLRLKNMDLDEMVEPNSNEPVEALENHYVKWNNHTHLGWYFGELMPGTHYLVEVVSFGDSGVIPDRPYFANFVTPNLT